MGSAMFPDDLIVDESQIQTKGFLICGPLDIHSHRGSKKERGLPTHDPQIHRRARARQTKQLRIALFDGIERLRNWVRTKSSCRIEEPTDLCDYVRAAEQDDTFSLNAPCRDSRQE